VGAHQQEARPPARPRRVPLLPGWGAGPRVRRRAGPEPLPCGAGRRDGRRRDVVSPTACCWPSARPGRLVAALRRRAPRYVHNLYGKARDVLAAREALGPGAHQVASSSPRMRVWGPGPSPGRRRGGGRGGDRPLHPGRLQRVGVGLTCGYEWGPAVGEGYEAPFPFNGIIERAEVEVTGPVVRNPLAEIAAILAEQWLRCGASPSPSAPPAPARSTTAEPARWGPTQPATGSCGFAPVDSPACRWAAFLAFRRLNHIQISMVPAFCCSDASAPKEVGVGQRHEGGVGVRGVVMGSARRAHHLSVTLPPMTGSAHGSHHAPEIQGR
jgi:hypothetical protein